MKKSNEIIYDIYNVKYLNEKSIRHLINQLVIEKDLSDYVKKIIVNNNSNKAGCYIISEKTVYINFLDIIPKTYKWLNHFPEDFSERVVIKFTNLFTIETILHELRHAYQVKEAESNKTDPIHKIIRENIELYNQNFIKSKLFNRLHYNDILTERDASITSIIELLENDEINCINEIEKECYLYPKLLKAIKKGYTSISPCEKFFKIIKKSNIYNSFDFKKYDYDYQTKLKWGLPIDQIDLNDIRKKDKNKILSKILSNNQNK